MAQPELYPGAAEEVCERLAGMRNCKQNKLLGEQAESCCEKHCEWPLIHQPRGEVQPSPVWSGINSVFLFYVLPVQVRGFACSFLHCSPVALPGLLPALAL